jgi:hypothetical protein
VIPGNLEPELAHFPRDKERRPVHTELTVSGLRAIRRHLEAARVGWLDLYEELYDWRV